MTGFLALRERIESLRGKDIKAAYANLLKLEEISESEDVLYPFAEDFLAMLDSDKYVIRVRGFRLLCKQARWDVDNCIDREIERILAVVQDEKPTAVRQALTALEDLVAHKAALLPRIREYVLAIDCAQYQESMRGLIEKDIQRLVELIDARQP